MNRELCPANYVRYRKEKERVNSGFPRGNDFNSARNRFRFRAEQNHEMCVFPHEIGLCLREIRFS